MHRETYQAGAKRDLSVGASKGNKAIVAIKFTPIICAPSPKLIRVTVPATPSAMLTGTPMSISTKNRLIAMNAAIFSPTVKRMNNLYNNFSGCYQGLKFLEYFYCSHHSAAGPRDTSR